MVSLNIKQRGQICVVDADIGLFGNRGLGVKRDAGAGQFQHAEVVGAVADRHDLGLCNTALARHVMQRLDLGLSAEDRVRNLAGQLAVSFDERVGAVLVKADHRADAAGEDGKAAGDQRGIAAIGLHRRDQFLASRR